MSKPDWAKIRAEYITGGISQRKLAAKYNVSETTLMKKAAAENWSKLKKETDNKKKEPAKPCLIIDRLSKKIVGVNR